MSPLYKAALDGATAAVRQNLNAALDDNTYAVIEWAVGGAIRALIAATPSSQPPPSQTPSAASAAPTNTYAAAKQAGYTGDMCQNATCGGFRVRRNGTCTVCDDCGSTTGCS